MFFCYRELSNAPKYTNNNGYVLRFDLCLYGLAADSAWSFCVAFLQTTNNPGNFCVASNFQKELGLSGGGIKDENETCPFGTSTHNERSLMDGCKEKDILFFCVLIPRWSSGPSRGELVYMEQAASACAFTVVRILTGNRCDGHQHAFVLFFCDRRK